MSFYSMHISQTLIGIGKIERNMHTAYTKWFYCMDFELNLGWSLWNVLYGFQSSFGCSPDAGKQISAS